MEVGEQVQVVTLFEPQLVIRLSKRVGCSKRDQLTRSQPKAEK